ncbi:MAG: leucyl/phenylalanyl-tRNA--protein transferase [Planctomycetota bacterium]
MTSQPDWSVELHISAYRAGYFPMADERAGDVGWYNPDPRAILPLREADGLHVPRTIERRIRQQRFELTSDTAFAEVVAQCARPRFPGDGRWIDPTMTRWYRELHDAGITHSLEAWRTDPATNERALVGGIFGLAIGRAFFAESMFHTPRPRRPDGTRDPLDGTDASAVCLVTLARHLHACGFSLLDVQLANEHTNRFGVTEVSRADFLPLVAHATDAPPAWRPIPAPAPSPS